MSEQTKQLQERFAETKFAKMGGAAFECSDYEGMYDDLVKFITDEQEKVRELLEEYECRLGEAVHEVSNGECHVGMALKDIVTKLDHAETK